MNTRFRSALAVSLSLLALTLRAQPVMIGTNRPPPAAPRPLPAGTRVMSDVAYVVGGHERQKLDLYLPPNDNGPLPLILWIHGGAWREGSKDTPPVLRFLTRGYAVASINYRLSQHAVFPAQLEDCKAAVRWLRAHAIGYGLDPDRFGAVGASAGGHLVALLGSTGDVKEFDVGADLEFSSRVQAVVDLFGPTDLLHMSAQWASNSLMDHDAPDSPESQLIGGTLQENPEKAKKASPITYVSKNAAPMLLVHGDADPLVPLQQSEELCAALKKAGAEATLHIVKGGGHGTGFGPDVNQLADQFFDRHLKRGK
jgi:acetyl esterase/lipase